MAVAALVASMLLADFRLDRRPSHFDEWRTLAWAQQTASTGDLSRRQPVGSPNGLARDISDRNRSLGFVALVAIWNRIANDPVADYKMLALVFVILYVLGLYFLSRELGARHWAAIVAALAIGTTSTDNMLLGLGLAVPSSLSLVLLTLALIGHAKLTVRSPARRRLWAMTLSTTGLILAVVYPLSLIFFLSVVAIDCLARPRLIRTGYIRALGCVALAGGMSLLFSESQGDWPTSLAHLSGLFFLDRRWHLVSAIYYDLDYVLSVPLLLLGLIGAALCARSRDQFWVASLLLGPLLIWAGYHFFSLGFIIPYQRLGLYLGLGACVCAAQGLEGILRATETYPLPRWLQAPILIGVALLIILIPRPSPPFESMAQIARPTPAVERIAARLSQSYESPARIYTAPGHAVYVEALAGLRVAPAPLDALLTGRPPPPFDCDEGWEVVVGTIHCPNYELLFQERGVSVFALQSKASLREEGAN